MLLEPHCGSYLVNDVTELNLKLDEHMVSAYHLHHDLKNVMHAEIVNHKAARIFRSLH